MKFLKKYLTNSLFGLLLLCLIAVFVVFFLLMKQGETPHLEVNASGDENLSEVVEAMPIPKLEEKKLVKGLFADYDPESFNEENITPSQKNEAQKEENPNALIDFKLNKNQLFNKQNDFLNFFKGLKFQDDNKSFKEQNISKKTPIYNNNKPKLSIIIDDMASKEQVRRLKATGLKLTPSFFPVDKNHPNTHHYAREFEFFMVHLPLAAMNFKREEIQTLKPHDTQEQIEAKIEQITKDFVGVKFINNHTGSLFTRDVAAMRKLFLAFQKYDLIFVDSITVGSSKGSLLAKEFNQVPIKRDIFLDNKDDINSIKAQIKKAVNLAHKNGFAIAIAHPKKNTFEALTQSIDLLQSVELVYLSEVYEYH
mgnify:CR=1 FL=1